jgi:DNA-directed RNA polymerase specialized sigma24 family protein
MHETRPSFTAANGENEPTSSAGLGPSHSAVPSDETGLRVEQLYGDYAGRVYRYCLSRLDSPEEAEDALQTTYLNAWRSLSRGAEPVAARPWLFQIAANVWPAPRSSCRAPRRSTASRRTRSRTTTYSDCRLPSSDSRCASGMLSSSAIGAG